MLYPKNRRIVEFAVISFLSQLSFTASISLAAEAGKQSLPAQVKINGSNLAAQSKAPNLPILISLNKKGGGCGNNGHGNDPDHSDSSNPGKGHGNDGTDADGKPGNGKGDDKGNCGVSKN